MGSRVRVPSALASKRSDQVPRRIFSSAALAMNAERVSPCAAAPSSIACSVPAIERDVGLGGFAALEDQRDNSQHRTARKRRFHVWIVAQCLQQSRARERYSLRPFAGRLHGVPQSLVEGAPHRRAARQIGKHHAIATAATFALESYGSCFPWITRTGPNVCPCAPKGRRSFLFAQNGFKNFVGRAVKNPTPTRFEFFDGGNRLRIRP